MGCLLRCSTSPRVFFYAHIMQGGGGPGPRMKVSTRCPQDAPCAHRAAGTSSPAATMRHTRTDKLNTNTRSERWWHGDGKLCSVVCTLTRFVSKRGLRPNSSMFMPCPSTLSYATCVFIVNMRRAGPIHRRRGWGAGLGMRCKRKRVRRAPGKDGQTGGRESLAPQGGALPPP